MFDIVPKVKINNIRDPNVLSSHTIGPANSSSAILIIFIEY